MGERLFIVHLPADSSLAGKRLAESRLGAILGLNVIAILRGGRTQLSPHPRTVLQADDRLLVKGRPDRLAELGNNHILTIEHEHLPLEQLISAEIGIAELRLSPRSSLLGQTIEQLGFRHRFGAVVLAIQRGAGVLRTNLETTPLQRDDVLLVQGSHVQLEALKGNQDLLVS